MDALAPAGRRIEVGHRRLLALALPMTLSHVTTPLLGLVDATVIGRLGEAPLLGAVAFGAVIFDFLFWSFGSLRMATARSTGPSPARSRSRPWWAWRSSSCNPRSAPWRSGSPGRARR
jgi:hypothetical protein